MKELAPYIIPALTAIVVAVIEALAARERKRARVLEESRRKEALLLLNLVYASGKLAEATAICYEEHKVNGELKAARKLFTQAEDEYNKFCQEQTKGRLL